MKWAIPAPSRCRYVSLTARLTASAASRSGSSVGSGAYATRVHVLGVPSHECKSIDRAAAAGEQIDRPASELLDYLVHVIGVLLRCRRGRRLGQLAASLPRGS